jgi:hypothetical protein
MINPILEDQGLHFMWLLPFDLSSMDDPTRSSRSCQHSSPVTGMRKPLHDKVVALEKLHMYTESELYFQCNVVTNGSEQAEYAGYTS